jgi:uncharacterized membrane protein (DUF2068 family)
VTGRIRSNKPFLPFVGALGVALMLVLAAATALPALGLWVGTRWGWRLAVALLAVHGVSDAVRRLTIEPRATSAIPVVVVAALLLFLARKNVHRWCALA